MKELGFKLYLLFMVSWFLHLTSRIPFLGAIRFDLLLAGILFLIIFVLIAQKEEKDFLKSETEKYLTLLIIYVILTIPFVQWPGSVIRFGIEGFIKAIVFYYFTVVFVTSEKKLKAFIAVFLACQTFRIVEPLYLHVTEGYWGSTAFMSGEFLDRLSGAPYDIVNPNGLAYIIVSVIPFYYFLSSISWKTKALCLIAFPLLIYTLILTASRSGMLGLFMVVLGIFVKSKKKLLFSIFVLIATFVVIAHLGPDQLDRYASIYDDSAANAATAQGRLEGIKSNLIVALRRPLFGHGLGTSGEANYNFAGDTHVAHNLYAELVMEIGFVGLIIFLFFIKSVIVNFVRSYKIFKQNLKENIFLIKLVDAMQVWLVMNIFFSFASYGLSRYAWYLFAGFSVVLMRVSPQGNSGLETTND